MPTTDFFDRHQNEIEEALKPKATWELLRDHAVPKIALEASMRQEECRAHAYPRTTQFVDPDAKGWVTADVPSVRWFDGRERLQENLLETRAEFETKIGKNLVRLKDAAAKDPSPKRLDAVKGYEKFIRDILPDNIRKFEKQKAETRGWLAKLERTPDLAKSLFTLIRGAENVVRAARGIAAAGEAWVSETELLYRVRGLLPHIEVVAHGQPKWLGRQHLDVWIPSIAVAAEYHGVQHFRPVEFFGGEEGFQRVQERDRRKRALCAANGTRLIEIIYDQSLDDDGLRALLLGHGREEGRSQAALQVGA